MADNYLITGYCGGPHVTAENDRGINAGVFGAGRYVLPVGKQFKAENIGNNTIRIYDGKLVDNGAAAGIPVGEYIDLFISNASQGMKRNDLIVFQYSQDSSTLIESGTFVVVRGTETSGTASDPKLTQEDLLTGRATFDQMPLWRIPVSTGTISTPVQLFEVSKSLDKAGAGIQTVAATSSDGVNYTANVEDVEELYAGLTVTIIPNRVSASTTPKLNVNGLGAITIRRPLSRNTANSVPSSDAAWMAVNKPVTVQYNGQYWLTGIPVLDPIDLNGSVPVKKGGTGLASVTAGNFLVGNGEGTMQEKTPAEVLSHIGALRFDLLWENGSPNSSFSGNTVTISGASEYPAIIVFTSDDSKIVKQYRSCQLFCCDRDRTHNQWWLRSRYVYFEGNDVEFGDSKTQGVKSGGVTFDDSDQFLIPLCIYGIKGMKWGEN